MKKQFLSKLAFTSMAVLLFFCACQTTHRASVKGSIAGLTDSSVVDFRCLDINKQSILDTLKPDHSGNFSYRFSITDKQPGFYYIYVDGVQKASMVIKPGDAVVVAIPVEGECSFEGSPESLDLAEANATLQSAFRSFDSLQACFAKAESAGDAALMEELNRSLARVYVKQKQSAIRFVMTKPGSFASVAVLYQTMPGNLPVFADKMDYLYIGKVCDSLKLHYPNSVFVSALENRYAELQRLANLDNVVSSIGDALGHPEICLPDIQANKRCLSELQGKVVLLSFWYSQDVDMRLDNRELVEIYNELHTQGFEVFQVAVERDKTAWAHAVMEQGLPWISLCDGLGTDSKVVGEYNLTEVPTHFLIDREGNIVQKVAIDGSLTALIKGFLKR